MNLDARLRRFFPFIVLAMIGLIAYFQASAIGNLLGSAVQPEGASEAPAPAASEAPTSADRDADRILGRNPFDSSVGPIEDAPDDEEHDGDEAEDDDDPVPSGGKCDFGKVSIIVANDDPRYAFATIAGADGKMKMRWVGDEVDGHRVASVTWDRVYLEKGASRCFLAVGEGKSAAAPTPEPAPSTDDLAAKIRKVSDTRFEIDRDAVGEILAADPLQGARMRPVKEGDAIVGLHLSRVRPGTLFEALGLQNGDRLEAINGVPITDPEKALEAYRRLETSGALEVEIRRGARPVTIALAVK